MNYHQDSSLSSTQRPLSLDEYTRYGRQMIMPGFGLTGQLKLKNSKVAVVGAGGLGCPVLQYLVGAGIGTIGIFDHDTVGLSNLHRQILHTTNRVGMNKAESACISLQALNPHPNLKPYPFAILPSTSISLLRTYDIIIDCTDRPITRYLLSDTAVRLGIPLVSGAAISSAGQWAVYAGLDGEGKRKRACYRCIWPSLLPGSGGNGTCEEEGVWGPVTGMIGTAMASEVIKLLIGIEEPQPLLHLLHLNSNPLIRTIRLRPPSTKCIACGPNATITDDLSQFEYETFCSGFTAIAKATTEHQEGKSPKIERISAKDLAKNLGTLSQRRIIDTRPEIEYGICALPNTINIPLSDILSSPLSVLPSQWAGTPQKPEREITFICRRGNDSQIAALALRSALDQSAAESQIGERKGIQIKDVIGGLVAWSKDVDPNFPVY